MTKHKVIKKSRNATPEARARKATAKNKTIQFNTIRLLNEADLRAEGDRKFLSYMDKAKTLRTMVIVFLAFLLSTSLASAQEVVGMGLDEPMVTLHAQGEPELDVWMLAWRVNGSGTFNHEGKTIYFTADGTNIYGVGVDMQRDQDASTSDGLPFKPMRLYYRFFLHDGSVGCDYTGRGVYLSGVDRIEVRTVEFGDDECQ